MHVTKNAPALAGETWGAAAGDPVLSIVVPVRNEGPNILPLIEEIAIALPRDQTLHDGAVLVLEPDHAIVVRVAAPRWLRFVPREGGLAGAKLRATVRGRAQAWSATWSDARNHRSPR